MTPLSIKINEITGKFFKMINKEDKLLIKNL